MSAFSTISNTISPLTTSAVERLVERRRRQADLITTLRRLAYLCSLQHQDEPSLKERCRIARLVTRCDDAMRKLLAEETG